MSLELPGSQRARVAADIRRVADELGLDARRLSVLDYQAVWLADQSLSSVAQVLSVFGTWKAGRAAASARNLLTRTPT